MSELFVDQSELEVLAHQSGFPVHIRCQDSQILVTGSYRLLGEKQFQAVLRLQKIHENRIVFVCVHTHPRFWMFDSFIKRMIFHWMQKSGILSSGDIQAVEIEYPYFTIDAGVIPAVQRVLEYLIIEGLDFESAGIRLRFHLKPADYDMFGEQETI